MEHTRINPVWFVNYSNIHSNRTTKCMYFDKLHEAEMFIIDRKAHGYIIRYGIENTLVKFFGDFIPSAQEQQKINNILNAQ
jgi:hypothetical protein